MSKTVASVDDESIRTPADSKTNPSSKMLIDDRRDENIGSVPVVETATCSGS